MLLLASRVFTALGIRVSRASRLLAAPVHLWRGCDRPRTIRRPAVRRMRLRQRRSVRPRLEPLEVRELLSSTPGVPDFSALRGDLTQLRNDATSSAVTLVNAVQPSPTNTPTLASVASQTNKAWSVLTTDANNTWQAVVQVEYAAWGAAQQMFETLLADLDKQLGIAPQSPPPPAPNTNSRSQQSSGLPAPPPAPLVNSSAASTPPPIRPAFSPSDPPSSISLTSSANPSAYGSAVTFTATVSGSSGPPTGSITFYDGTTVLGTGTVNASGIATCTTSSLTVGNHDITAIYSGDSTYAGSTNWLTQTVNLAIFTTGGNWVAPFTGTVTVLCTGGGGGGGAGGNDNAPEAAAGGGGGGGAIEVTVSVTSGNTYTVTVGAGGAGALTAGLRAAGGIGGNSSFALGSTVYCTANGGGGGMANVPEAGGSGGASSYGNGAVLVFAYTGGNGGSGAGGGGASGGGGGGGGAGTSGNGDPGGKATGGTTGAGGAAGTGGSGGGGAGGTGGTAPTGAGTAGSSLGGGGGGGAGTANDGVSGGNGAAGANGEVEISSTQQQQQTVASRMTLLSSANPSRPNQSVTFTATV
ncbi:MAG TPA: Ig-like domain-containing protein, partial [Gemmataceae bacterium]